MDMDFIGTVTGSAAVIDIVKNNLGFNVNNDFISRLESEGPLKDLELVENSIGRGFQARNFSKRDLMVIFAVLYVENSIAEMARNTRTPYKYQYYALGRYYYEKYERAYETYSIKDFIQTLPDDIIQEGIANDVIGEVSPDSRKYNLGIAKAVVVTFFYYMSILDKSEMVDIIEFSNELKTYVEACKASLLNYSPARIQQEAKSFKSKGIANHLAEVWEITGRASYLAQDLMNFAKVSHRTPEIRAWMELVYRADTNQGYLARIALKKILVNNQNWEDDLEVKQFLTIVKIFVSI